LSVHHSSQSAQLWVLISPNLWISTDPRRRLCVVGEGHKPKGNTAHIHSNTIGTGDPGTDTPILTNSIDEGYSFTNLAVEANGQNE
jgi:hypothetical protein